MKKQRFSLLGLAFALLLILVAVFFARLTMHRPPEVALAQPEDASEQGGAVADAQQEAIRRVEVTPSTVQRVIERLARPERYARTMTVERFWADGSGTSTATVRVSDGWTRVDVSEEDVEQRHVINGDGKTWVWYGSGGRVFTGAAALNADEEQSIPTYEKILGLSTASIVQADYRALENVNCIYVETAPDAYGYTERYWVSVDSGLLVSAERLRGETVVYRMTGLEVTLGSVTEQAFQLPGGTTLYDPRGPESAGAAENGETEQEG